METKGVIYILTNPSFSEYVKIGYADDVKVRVAQLNRSECTPFAFRIYATLKVPSRLADKNVHALIDKLQPELRSKDNVNGKIRVREFFALTPDAAYEILSLIGGIYGETPVKWNITPVEAQEEHTAIEVNVAQEKRSPFSFYKCGIKSGEYIQYIFDTTVNCKVTGDREIEYKGKKTSVSALAQKLLGKKTVQGTLYFSYKGESLSALRKRLEDEGKYGMIEEQLPDTKSVNNSEQRVLLEKRSPFSFNKCGIKNGEHIQYIFDETIDCKVVGDREIEYNGKKTSLSALAKKLLGKKTIQGTLYFTYRGEILSKLRDRIEKEGKYGSI